MSLTEVLSWPCLSLPSEVLKMDPVFSFSSSRVEAPRPWLCSGSSWFCGRRPWPACLSPAARPARRLSALLGSPHSCRLCRPSAPMRQCRGRFYTQVPRSKLPCFQYIAALKLYFGHMQISFFPINVYLKQF